MVGSVQFAHVEKEVLMTYYAQRQEGLEKRLVIEKEWLRGMVLSAEQDISQAPPGKLYVTESHGFVQFRHRLPDKKIAYLKKGDDRVRQLAQAEYARSVLHSSKFCLRQIDRLCSEYGIEEEMPDRKVKGKAVPEVKVLLQQDDRGLKTDPHPSLTAIKSIYEELPLPRKPLVKPYVMPDAAFVQSWREENPISNSIDKEGCVFVTAGGFAVRSKSEVIIADRLHAANIPFRYEQPLRVGRLGLVHPDFFILNAHTRREVVWEHFGIMDNPDYCDRALRKIALYAKAGLVPGDGLIVTFESSSQPLDIRAVESYVEALSA